MDSFPDEEMCDLETLEALLMDDEDFSSLPQSVGDKKEEAGNNKKGKADFSDEVAEFMNAQSDDSDDESSDIVNKSTTSSHKNCPEGIERSPLMHDSTEEEQFKGQKQVSQRSLPASEVIQDTPSTSAIMKEMEEMKRKMEDLQNQLKMQQQHEHGASKVSVKKEKDLALSEKKSQPRETMLSGSKPPMRLMAEEEEGNFFFSRNKSSEVKSLKSSPGSKRPPAFDSRKVEVEGATASSKPKLDDSDSDWEDLDGDNYSNLNEEGKKLKQLLKLGEKRREAHRSSFGQNFTPDPSYSKESNQRVKANQGNSFDGREKRATIDRHSLQCASSSTDQSKSGTQKAKDTEKMIIEDFSRIRIVNPLISSSVMKMRMDSRKLITVSRIHAKLNTADLQSDWVTIGVLVSKTNAKASSSGKPYSIWKLSDLHDLEHCVSFFLFGQVHKSHWKLDVGSVVGLLNPSMMEATEKGKSEPAFTLKNPNQLMVMGLSKDLGWCIGHTRKGNKCPHFINKRQGDYCSYHVQAEYKKTSAQRLEFHGSVTGVRPKSFEQKIFAKNCAYIYGGNTFVPSSSSSKGKNGVTLSKLQEKVSSGRKAINTFSIQDIKPSTETMSKDKKVTEDKNDLFMDMISVPSPGSMNLVAHLKKSDSMDSKVCSPLTSKMGQKMESISASDLLKQHQKKMRMRQPVKTKASDLLMSNGGHQRLSKSGNESSDSGKNLHGTPCDPLREMPLLGKGLSSGQDIHLFDSGRDKALSLAEKSKLKAIMALKSKGDVLKKEDPNAVKKCKGEKDLQAIKKRALKEENTSGSDEASSSSQSASPCGPKAKRSKLLGNVDLNSAEVKAILKAKSKHVGALAEKEAEREETYFEGLEKKEVLEEKMKSVTSIEISVFTCKQCHYTAESASDECKKNQHSIVKSKAKKRFFACKKCKHRTTTINGMFPSSPCQKCGAFCYEKTSMYKERKGPKLDSEILSLRGDEVKYLNSLDQKVFMNTVVD